MPVSTESGTQVIDVPRLLPVLPVRNTVLFPNAAVPLMVGRSKSLKAIRAAQKAGDLILVVAQKDGSKEDPGPGDLHRMGVVCLLGKLTQLEKESFQLLANGLHRFELTEVIEQDGHLVARGTQLSEADNIPTPRAIALMQEIRQQGKAILTMAAIPGAEALAKLFQQIDEPAHIADLCCTFLQLPVAIKQELLEQRDLTARLTRVLDLVLREKEKLLLQNEIQSKMMERLSKDQRDHLLREQIRTIHEELGDEANFQEEYAQKIEAAGLSPEAQKVAKEELARLNLVQRSSPEFHVIRTYLDWMVALPWKTETAPTAAEIDLAAAEATLETDHYGLSKVKKRILQFLAVNRLKNSTRGPVLCFVGPPGVGKTSLGKSIAKALGRNFIRTSLGGVRDEAEIRGHRRTYIGALPGKILQTLKRVKSKDPVILLDEIDKLGSDFRGDPSSALLEVLDPEQNTEFQDHYLDVPFDLSKVFFITTANQLESIPPALRDRLEVIELSSYSREEKKEILQRHLLPKALTENGLKPEQLNLAPEVTDALLDFYTREAGVRTLSRELSTVCRSAAELIARGKADKVQIAANDLTEILGPQKYFLETAETHRPGVSTGLAWTALGGEILHIEVTAMPGKGQLLLTGKLGEVMRESAQIALSFLRSYWSGQMPFKFGEVDFHIHVPSGAVPKDGPSAGIALFTALASLLQEKSLPGTLAMTGEITLRGKVLPVGGIKEKVLAAHRAGIKTVCLPEKNRGDLAEIPKNVLQTLQFHYLTEVAQILPLVGLATAPEVPPDLPTLHSLNAPIATA